MQDFFNYLAEEGSTFGPLAWIFFAIQLAAVLGGLYILYIRTDTNAVRRGLWRQLAIGLLIAGGVGLLLAVLRLANVPVLNQRYWFYIQLLIQIGLAAYVFYFSRTRYPVLIAASLARGRGAPVRRAGAAPRSPSGASASARNNATRSAGSAPARTPASTPAQPAPGGPTVPTIGRPTEVSGRRESRRDRKRRSR